MLNLVVHLPVGECAQETSLQVLAKRAPSFALEEEEGRKAVISVFPRLPEAIDLALHLIEESLRIPGAWASVNTRRMPSLHRLKARIECYRESLAAPSPELHCFRKAAQHNLLVGCLNPSCPVPCQFVCASCRADMVGKMAPPDPLQLDRLAREAEVDWCPNLHLVGVTARMELKEGR